jgi:hypothetical protein
MAKVPDYKSFITSMDDYDWFLWSKGATLEGIQWYKSKLAEMKGDKWRMQSENPTTEMEAFQSTGNRVFPPQHVEKMRKFCYPPTAKGKLFSNAEKGKEALKNIQFFEIQEENLWIWDFPSPPSPLEATSHPSGWIGGAIKNRYLVVVDIGGKTDKADYSVITVFDRYSLLEGGVPQVVARCRYHIDQDVLAWDTAMN